MRARPGPGKAPAGGTARAPKTGAGRIITPYLWAGAADAYAASAHYLAGSAGTHAIAAAVGVLAGAVCAALFGTAHGNRPKTRPCPWRARHRVRRPQPWVRHNLHAHGRLRRASGLHAQQE